MHQARHPDRRGTQQQFGTIVEVIGADDLFVKLDPRQPREQEATQGPRRVVLATDQERSHVAFLHRSVPAALQYNA
jgi:hypothetical protein